MDSASLLVEIEKKNILFWVCGSLGGTSQMGMSFLFYWPSLGLVYVALDVNRMGQLFHSSFCRN